MWNIVFAALISVVTSVLLYYSLDQHSPKLSFEPKPPVIPKGAPRALNEVIDEIQQAQQQQFDSVVQRFMQQCLTYRDARDVFAMRDDLMAKLPECTVHEVRRLDLGEWSLYFSVQAQSYEYYIGRYGIFQLHVDRLGEEHKLSLWQTREHPDALVSVAQS